MVKTLKAEELRTVSELPVYMCMYIYYEACCSNLLFVKVKKKVRLKKNVLYNLETCFIYSWQQNVPCYTTHTLFKKT
jgi:hypothetical protein